MSPKIFTLLIVLTTAFLYYGFYIPAFNATPGLVWTPKDTIPSLQAQSVTYTNALTQISEVERGAAKLNSDYLAVSTSTIARMQIMLPNQVDKLKLINEVKAIADKAEVPISNVLVTEDTRYRSSDMGAYNVTFNLKARYPAFKRLMAAFEKNMRFYSVTAISIKRPIEGQTAEPGNAVFDKEALTMSVTFRVYYLKR
jgi:hypothetical protein